MLLPLTSSVCPFQALNEKISTDSPSLTMTDLCAIIFRDVWIQRVQPLILMKNDKSKVDFPNTFSDLYLVRFRAGRYHNRRSKKKAN